MRPFVWAYITEESRVVMLLSHVSMFQAFVSDNLPAASINGEITPHNQLTHPATMDLHRVWQDWVRTTARFTYRLTPESSTAPDYLVWGPCRSVHFQLTEYQPHTSPSVAMCR